MKNKEKTPPKWTAIYPQGSKEGDEEQEFFIALSRNPKWQWRSTASIAKEAKLTKERVEEILDKYYRKGMVFQNPSNEDQWGYWERVPEMLPKEEESITDKDHNDRINNVKAHTAIWDFNIALGETIKEKYKSFYVNLVEVL